MNTNPQITPLNILFADDDVDDRFFFEKALREIPIASNLTTVIDGEHLMDYLSENIEQLPDVLFLDLSMPRKSGFECLSEIRENIKLNDMPVVMYSTSYTSDKNYEESMIDVLFKMGAQGFIRKPGDFAKLKQVIHDELVMMFEKKSINQN
ncbi:MAG: response regulator [Saprospiraceae bacterium]|nr:response regulator [Saprospiraceae bacterium]